MSSLFFDFIVDKTAKTVFITREFAADQSLVWDAFTTPELLDQWWAPKPFVSKTIKMDFSVGGRRFYAMVSPDGTEIGWQIFEYTSITPKSNFKCLSFFTDKDENPHPEGAIWDVSFSELHAPAGREITKAFITIQFDSLAHIEKMIEMGFKEGFTVTLSELANLLETLKNRK